MSSEIIFFVLSVEPLFTRINSILLSINRFFVLSSINLIVPSSLKQGITIEYLINKSFNRLLAYQYEGFNIAIIK